MSKKVENKRKTAVEFILFLAAGEKSKVMKTDVPSVPEITIRRNKTHITNQRHLLRTKFWSKVHSVPPFSGQSRFSLHSSKYLSTSFSKQIFTNFS